MKPMLRTFSRTFLTIFTLAAFALPAQAQAAPRPLDDKSDAWWDRYAEQLDHSLNSDVQQIRSESVRTIIFLATYYPDKADFTRSTGKLLDVYRFDRSEANRSMALSALSAIGDEYCMQVLSQEVRTERSERIRTLTLAALAKYQQAQRAQVGRAG